LFILLILLFVFGPNLSTCLKFVGHWCLFVQVSSSQQEEGYFSPEKGTPHLIQAARNPKSCSINSLHLLHCSRENNQSKNSPKSETPSPFLSKISDQNQQKS